MRRTLLVFLGLLFFLVGCQPEPTVPEEPFRPSRRPVPQPLVTPTPAPPNIEVVERTLDGLPNSDFLARMQQRKQASVYLARRDFTHLEAIEQRFHDWPHCEDYFQNRLYGFYLDCGRVDRSNVEAWLKASPESHAAHLAKARIALSTVYSIYAKTPPTEVSEDVRKRVEPWLEKAEANLAGQDVKSCPQYYTLKIELASLRGAPQADITEILAESDRILPGYLPTYAEAAVHRLPGRAGAMSTAAEGVAAVAATIPTPNGVDPKLWERARLGALVSHMWASNSHMLSPQQGHPWPELKKSYIAVRELSPKSSFVMGRLARSAFVRGEPELLAELLGALGDRWDRSYFPDYAQYSNAAGSVDMVGEQVDFDPLEGALKEFPLPEAITRRFFQREVGGLLLRGRFSELEELYKRLAEKPNDTRWGSRGLEFFYDALSLETQDEKINWKGSLDVANLWLEVYPESLAAKFCLAEQWSNYAWDARGHGYASEVSDENFALFRERMSKSVVLYEELLSKNDDPLLRSRAGGVLLLSGGDPERGFQWLDQALSADPTNVDLIYRSAHFLLPRWFGRPGDLKKLMMTIEKKSGKKSGKAIVLCKVLPYVKARVYETEISWAEAKEAFQDLIQESDTPRHHGFYALAAYYADDRATARENLKGLDHAWYDHAFKSREHFLSVKAWAEEKE